MWKLSKQVSGSDQYVCCQARLPPTQLHIAPEIQIKTQFWNQTPVSVTLQKRKDLLDRKVVQNFPIKKNDNRQQRRTPVN